MANLGDETIKVRPWSRRGHEYIVGATSIGLGRSSGEDTGVTVARVCLHAFRAVSEVRSYQEF